MRDREPQDHQAGDGLSETPGTFVAALFAVTMLAFIFIQLSDQLQSHLKAGVVTGASVAIWLLLAAFLRLRIDDRIRRLLAKLCAAAAVVGSAFVVELYVGRVGLKWLSILVAGFYLLKLVFNLLEHFADSIFIKIILWTCLGAGAVLLFYQVGG